MDENTPLGQTVVNLLEETLHPVVPVVVVDPLCDAECEYGVVRSIAVRYIRKVLPMVQGIRAGWLWFSLFWFGLVGVGI